LFSGEQGQGLEIHIDYRSMGPKLIQVIHFAGLFIKEMENDLTVIDAEPAGIVSAVDSQTGQVQRLQMTLDGVAEVSHLTTGAPGSENEKRGDLQHFPNPQDTDPFGTLLMEKAGHIDGDLLQLFHTPGFHTLTPVTLTAFCTLEITLFLLRSKPIKKAAPPRIPWRG